MTNIRWSLALTLEEHVRAVAIMMRPRVSGRTIVSTYRSMAPFDSLSALILIGLHQFGQIQNGSLHVMMMTVTL